MEEYGNKFFRVLREADEGWTDDDTRWMAKAVAFGAGIILTVSVGILVYAYYFVR